MRALFQELGSKKKGRRNEPNTIQNTVKKMNHRHSAIMQESEKKRRFNNQMNIYDDFSDHDPTHSK